MNKETGCGLCYDGTSDIWECYSCGREIVESRSGLGQDWNENTLILAAQKFCRETYDMSGEKEEYHEKFGALICFIKDVIVPSFRAPSKLAPASPNPNA